MNGALVSNSAAMSAKEKNRFMGLPLKAQQPFQVAAVFAVVPVAENLSNLERLLYVSKRTRNFQNTLRQLFDFLFERIACDKFTQHVFYGNA